MWKEKAGQNDKKIWQNLGTQGNRTLSYWQIHNCNWVHVIDHLSNCQIDCTCIATLIGQVIEHFCGFTFHTFVFPGKKKKPEENIQQPKEHAGDKTADDFKQPLKKRPLTSK